MSEEQEREAAAHADDEAAAAAKAKEEARRAALEKAKAAKAAKAAAAAKAGDAAAGPDRKPAAKKAAAEEKPAAPVTPEPLQQIVEDLQRQFAKLDFQPLYNAADEHLYIKVPREHLLAVSRYLRDEQGFDYLRCLSGVDWTDRLQVVYQLTRLRPGGDKNKALLAVQVDVDREEAVCPSVTEIWPTADFNEREVFDLFGIKFTGHPNLRRILLPDHWQGGYPLRKDFIDKRPKKPRKIRPR